MPKIKDWANKIYLEEYVPRETHLITLYVNAEYVKFIGNKNITKNVIYNKIYRIQAYDSIICRYFLSDLLISCSEVKVY